MLAKIKTCGVYGLHVSEIEAEVDISNGLPAINIVGLGDMAIRESKERVRAAIKNSGASFPMKRITINLAPADTKKEGTHFDLPIALGILAASEQIKMDMIFDFCVLGELSLDGKVNKVNGVLPMLLGMFNKGYRKIILPKENVKEARLVEEMEIYGVSHLQEVIQWLNNEETVVPVTGHHFENEKFTQYDHDIRYLKGQDNLKRALEIAAAGGHNLLMVGPPGAGKTMAARSLSSIMPQMTFEEALEVTKIHSVAGILDSEKGLVNRRPFRSPHHTISVTALTGGGRIPKPGEVSLCHYGVLFLDELPEFSKGALEVLRQPLEDRVISISRAHSSCTYPADFMLVVAMNPCPCGYYGSEGQQSCTCGAHQINRYLNKISGPLLDRIDLMIEVRAVSYGDLKDNDKSEESSKCVGKRVQIARELQQHRYKQEKVLFNAQLNTIGINKYCVLEKEAEELLKMAFDKMKLSVRSHNRVIKVSRTIADLDKSEIISKNHLAEALQYRNLNHFSRR
ncbi:Mg chelatase, subunit ChlI [Alkaliphilus metalliredigens QYMF]|uniref:Mg chelatase, subunit ChlI n=1 Tax=Alkaliphilus metalliredigens (strain QYMF) TaxID=293826 RepID=A6TRS0_ALKMQ|nr:YifB family Mg chelatase-like AAA ATPase [Alkaliphilus metalliredigens]ABR48888.1 Mg chelatase, subunit ChlI [Alkaliphilus metalliredigens QYMF]